MSGNTANKPEKKPGMGKYVVIGIVVLIFIIVIANSIFVLYEGQSILVQRFGRIESVHLMGVTIADTDESRAQLATRNEVRAHLVSRNVRVVEGTGLRFRIPFIDTVIRYPDKLILYVSPTNELLTLDRHRLYFDKTAVWRIENPLLFFEAFETIDRAKMRIDHILYSEMRLSVGQMSSYVVTSDRILSANMLRELADNVNLNFAGQGISIFDIRIKRTDLPEETFESIFNRMNTERQRVAAENRAEGERTLLEIRSRTDRDVITITSLAEREAEEIRGAADREAARIYNEAYSRYPAFFEFYNLLQTYRMTIGSGSTLVVPLDSPFAMYLLGAQRNNDTQNAETEPPPAVLPDLADDEDEDENS